MAKEQTVSQVLQIGQANEEMKRRKDAQQGLTGRRTGSAPPLTRGKRARRLCICRAEERRHSKRSAFPPRGFGRSWEPRRKPELLRSHPFTREFLVPLQGRLKFEPKGKEIRGAGRLNSRVRLAIESTEEGKVVRAEGYTKDVSRKGCLALVPHAFAVGQKVRVINLVNQNASDAYLIWRGHQGPAGWELGIELHEPTADFWGVDF